MRFISLAILMIFYFSAYGQLEKVVKPILVDKDALSGLNLKAVKNKDQPDRRLFQRNIFWVGIEL